MTKPDTTDVDALHVAAPARINQKITGEGRALPAVRLKDGCVVQTGFVQALYARGVDLWRQPRSQFCGPAAQAHMRDAA